MSAITDLVARLPWVTRLERTQDCDAYRWGHMPLAALDSSQTMAKYRCRNRARWQFTALRDAFLPASDGVYCWPHLGTALRHNMEEWERTARGLQRLRAEDENRRQETMT
jgi:hypothetical protein